MIFWMFILRLKCSRPEELEDTDELQYCMFLMTHCMKIYQWWKCYIRNIVTTIYRFSYKDTRDGQNAMYHIFLKKNQSLIYQEQV